MQHEASRMLAALFSVAGSHWLAGVGLLAGVVLALTVRRAIRGGRPDRWLDTFANVIGLGFSLEGMYEVTTQRMGFPWQLAAVLCCLFEAFLVAGMVRASLWRHDPARRSRHVRFFWSCAFIMGATVATASDSVTEVPVRLAIPMLIAWQFYLGLTADDAPGVTGGRTSWRWTPRFFLLMMGAVTPGDQDAPTINRELHAARMTNLAFRIRWGSQHDWVLQRRRVRAARLAMTGDRALLADVAGRVALAASFMEPEAPMPDPIPPQPAPAVYPVPDEQPVEPEHVQPGHPAPEPTLDPGPDEKLPQGAHRRDGQVLRGETLHADGIRQLLASVSDDRPRGVTAAELAALYSPPLKMRTAETIAAGARKSPTFAEIQRARLLPVNGSRPLDWTDQR